MAYLRWLIDYDVMYWQTIGEVSGLQTDWTSHNESYLPVLMITHSA